MRQRPPIPTLEAVGAHLRSVREAKGWTQRQAAKIAKEQGRVGLGYSMLSLLESGRVQTPTRAIIAALSELYKEPYEPLAARFAAAIYGIQLAASDLSLHTSTGTLAPEKGGANEPDTARIFAAGREEGRREGQAALVALAKAIAAQIKELAGCEDQPAADGTPRTRTVRRNARR